MAWSYWIHVRLIKYWNYVVFSFIKFIILFDFTTEVFNIYSTCFYFLVLTIKVVVVNYSLLSSALFSSLLPFIKAQWLLYISWASCGFHFVVCVMFTLCVQSLQCVQFLCSIGLWHCFRLYWLNVLISSFCNFLLYFLCTTYW